MSQEPSPTRSALRLLLPIVAITGLVGAMIVGGIHRNRTRVAGNQSQLQKFAEAVRSYREEGFAYLREQQRHDGSWPSFGGPSRDLTLAQEIPALLSTRRIALNLESAGYGETEVCARAAALVSSSAGDREDLAGIVSEHGSDDPESLVFRLAELVETERTSALEAATRQRLAETSYEPAAWLELGYVASLAAVRSERVRGLMPLFADGFRSRSSPGAWRELDNLALASWIDLQIQSCLDSGDPCRDVNSAIGELAGRRRADGSWAGGALRISEGLYEGSDAETTSLAVRALASYERLLTQRLGGR